MLINSIDKKSGSITVDPGASEDSFVQFDINGTSKFKVGVDDDDSDAFKISHGSALGTTDTFIMSSEGEQTIPLQSAFSAYLSSTASNVTGDGTVYTIICDTKSFDLNSDYNNTTGLFTAPVTGKYCILMTTFMTVEAAGGSTMRMQPIIGGDNFYVPYAPARKEITNLYGPNTNLTMFLSIIRDLDAADTVVFAVRSFGGTKINDIYGGSIYTVFSVYLIC